MLRDAARLMLRENDAVRSLRDDHNVSLREYGDVRLRGAGFFGCSYKESFGWQNVYANISP
jgi:hypothetical protein